MTTTVREQHPRSHHKGATGRVRTGNQRYPVLCHCQLGQDIPVACETGLLYPNLLRCRSCSTGASTVSRSYQCHSPAQVDRRCSSSSQPCRLTRQPVTARPCPGCTTACPSQPAHTNTSGLADQARTFAQGEGKQNAGSISLDLKHLKPHSMSAAATTTHPLSTVQAIQTLQSWSMRTASTIHASNCYTPSFLPSLSCAVSTRAPKSRMASQIRSTP